MGSSLPDVLDYLASRIPKLPAVQGLDPALEVEDGWPATRGDTLLALGVTPDDEQLGITQAYEGLGEESEICTVRSTIYVRRTGDGMTARARRDAHLVLDAIRALVAADRRLGKAILPGQPARITAADMRQTATAGQAGTGRVCEIRWALAWAHRL